MIMLSKALMKLRNEILMIFCSNESSLDRRLTFAGSDLRQTSDLYLVTLWEP